MKMIKGMAALFVAAALVSSCKKQDPDATMIPPTVDRIDVDMVLSHFPVGFSLITHGENQFVAYYDFSHQMTVASRKLSDRTWVYQKLPSKIGWDSHNYIEMKIDREGYIHLCGNMHASPLVYFRTKNPLDITSFEAIHRMTGENEGRTTYPKFMDGPDGSLVFHYRDGVSGDGNEIYNIYDYATKTWKRLLDTPLTDGKGLMNAYIEGPTLGPDDYYHIAWVWRDPDGCEFNHDLSYARSRDLVHWESAAGDPVTLPITLDQEELLIDPIPVNGGIINGAAKVGFDNQKRPLVTYHKFDEEGNTQAYIARFEDGAWEIAQISNWNYRWAFSGVGSIQYEIGIQPAVPCGDGLVKVSYSHVKYGSGYWMIRESDLTVAQVPTRSGAAVSSSPMSLAAQPTTRAVLAKTWKRQADAGESSHTGKKFYLEWKCFPVNRDQQLTEIQETPSLLQLVAEPLTEE